MNTIYTIQPYRYAGGWVFDDASRGLDKEPFVCGIPEIIDGIVGAGVDRFQLLFSAMPFPSATHILDWTESEQGGNWYTLRDNHPIVKKVGWLCPALFRYFSETPRTIYASIATEVR